MVTVFSTTLQIGSLLLGVCWMCHGILYPGAQLDSEGGGNGHGYCVMLGLLYPGEQLDSEGGSNEHGCCVMSGLLRLGAQLDSMGGGDGHRSYIVSVFLFGSTN